MKNVAIGIDARSGENLDKVQDMLEILKSKDVQYEVLFLDAEDAVLVKRYKETRRSHPLAQGERVDKGIMRERQKMEFLKKEADYIIDTSRLLTRELKTELEKIFVQDEEFNSMYVTILSFGFKYGIPADSDIVMDVRFLPNPYYVEELRPKTGNDVEIQQYVMKYDEAKIFLKTSWKMFGGVGRALHSGGRNRARKPGSIGACSYPAKVFKGMRMGGQLGGDRVTVQNLQVLKVIADHNLLLIKGSIPGCKGSIVIIEK